MTLRLAAEREKPVNEEVVATLTSMLAQAESGDLVALGVAYVMADGSFHSLWERSDDHHGRLALSIMGLHWAYGQAICGERGD
jgi:hypothetical protein